MMKGTANTVLEYTDEFGKSPYNEWLGGLKDETTKRKIIRQVEKMRHGLLGNARPVGGGVSELRIHFGPGYRVYYGKQGNRIYLLLCGGDKSTQRRDIEKAKSCWQNHKRRNK